jgi:hypothetical protein
MLIIIAYNPPKMPEMIMNCKSEMTNNLFLTTDNSDMNENGFNYLEMYLFKEGEKNPCYMYAFRKSGVILMEASSQRLNTDPIVDTTLPRELIVHQILEGNDYLIKNSLTFSQFRYRQGCEQMVKSDLSLVQIQQG